MILLGAMGTMRALERTCAEGVRILNGDPQAPAMSWSELQTEARRQFKALNASLTCAGATIESLDQPPGRMRGAKSTRMALLNVSARLCLNDISMQLMLGRPSPGDTRAKSLALV